MSASKPAAGSGNLTLLACIALCLLAPLSGLAHSGISPILPKISEHFSYVPDADVLVRLMATGLSAAMIFGALVSGLLADRIGQTRLLLAALVVFALTGSAGFWLENIYALLASRILLGVANASAGVLAMALITTRVVEAMRDRWMGFYIVTGNVGSLAFIIAVGALGKIDWRLVFLLYLLALPVALFVALTFKQQSREEVRSQAVAAGGGIPWGMTAFGLLCGAIGTSALVFLPFHLATIGLGGPEKVAPAIMVSMAFGSIFAFSYGWLRKFASATTVFVVGFTVTGIGLLIAAGTTGFAALLIAMAVYGAGFGVVTPNFFATCAAATPPESRARVLGFIRAGFYAGPLAAQPLLEAVLRSFGPTAAVVAIAMLSIAAAAIALMSRKLFVPVEATQS